MISGWILAAGIGVGAYALLMVLYRHHFQHLRPFLPLPASRNPTVSFSVLIPARNESACIAACIRSIFSNTYPGNLYEVIVIDDYSEDDTAQQVMDLQIEFAGLQLIRLSDHTKHESSTLYKKRALEVGIRESKGDWIVTTDADALVSGNWLSVLNSYILERDPVLIAAPVIFHSGKSILSVFQELDFMTMQGITAASVVSGMHSMCNGANLAYKKETFYAVGGFAGNEHLATGDDMLLMHKVKRAYPEKIGYLFSKDAIVTTRPQESWKAFFQQRIRWASKAESYGEPIIFGVLLGVWLINTLLLFGIAAVFFDRSLFYPWLTLMVIKTVMELYFLFPVATFFERKNLLIFFPFLQPLHLVYMVVAGWLGKFGSYEWKNRIIVTPPKP
ncbi:MAG: glycosyltransferase [Sediminibacterium sp.]